MTLKADCSILKTLITWVLVIFSNTVVYDEDIYTIGTGRRYKSVITPEPTRMHESAYHGTAGDSQQYHGTTREDGGPCSGFETHRN